MNHYVVPRGTKTIYAQFSVWNADSGTFWIFQIGQLVPKICPMLKFRGFLGRFLRNLNFVNIYRDGSRWFPDISYPVAFVTRRFVPKRNVPGPDRTQTGDVPYPLGTFRTHPWFSQQNVGGLLCNGISYSTGYSTPVRLYYRRLAKHLSVQRRMGHC